MPDINWIEWIGYLGSALVALSLTMSSIVKLRWLNLGGSLIFSAYGYIIDATPVLAVNSLITLVNIFYLIKMYSKKDYFKILEVRPNSLYLQAFLDFHKQSIVHEFPNFKLGVEDRLVYLILRNMAVTGVFIGKKERSSLAIELDFVIPPYQDFKSGKFLLVENQKLFADQGFDQLWVPVENKRNERYFRKMGFQKENRDGKEFQAKKVSPN